MTADDLHVVVATAGLGGAQEEIAAAVVRRLRGHHGDRVRVSSIDLLARCAPRSARLARIASRGGEEFFPDGSGTLSQIAPSQTDDPIVRELVSSGAAAAESALRALRPSVVFATHPVAGAIAAEVRSGRGYATAALVPDLWPRRLWLHPDVDLYFVACPEARDALASRGLPWARMAVTGVPIGEPGADGEEVAGEPTPHPAGFTALVAVPGGDDAVAEALVSHAIRVVRSAPADGVPTRSPERANSVRTFRTGESIVRAMAGCDVVVCGPCGTALWAAVAMGVPMVVIEPVSATERSSVDLLATAGAAVVARDAEDAAIRAGYLGAHPERHAQMRRAAAELGRGNAVRAVCERLLAMKLGV